MRGHVRVKKKRERQQDKRGSAHRKKTDWVFLLLLKELSFQTEKLWLAGE